MINTIDQNTKAQKTRSFASRLFSVFSVPPCFKFSRPEHDQVLTPGRYVGAEEVEDDGVPFAERVSDHH